MRQFVGVSVGVVVGVLLGVGVTVSVGTHHGSPGRGGVRPGDCVEVAAPSPDGELHATAASCSRDPSFTVAKFADPMGDCTPRRYDQFAPPFADVATGRLCLVPNLVVGHCYRFGVPVGMWDLVDCAGAGRAAIKVTKRVEVDDPNACPTETPSPTPPGAPGIRTLTAPRALPYPSRTYCYGDAK